MKNLSNQLNIRLLSVILIALGMAAILLLSFSLDVAAGSLIPPQIVSKYPQNGSHDAEVTTSISTTFDQDMDPATVNPQTFAVHARQTGWLTETLSVDGATIMLQPSNPLHAGELVQASATTGLLSMEGEPPLEPAVWSFTTASWGGNAHFLEKQLITGVDSRDIELGDLDKDGDLDAVTTSCFSNFHGIYHNDGTGVFTLVQSFGFDTCFLDAELGDLDGDGDLDIIFVDHWFVGTKVLWNNGDGTFTNSGQALGMDDCYGELGDLDGDGDLDYFVTAGGYGTNTLQVWKNDGTGIFTLFDDFDTAYNHMDVKLGDLNGDGALDAFTAGWNNTYNKVWLNDGTGIFTEAQVIANANTTGVQLGDLNGDGYLDVYLANTAFNSTDLPDEVWLNDHTGHFINSGQTLGTVGSAFPALGDLDADGDLDVYLSGDAILPQADEVWVNDGEGIFTLARTMDEDYPGGGVALGDLDGDGNLDAFTGSDNESYSYQVYLNGNWTRVADAPEELFAYAFAQCPEDPDKLYVMTGQPFVYDIENDVWVDLATAPVGWWWSSAVCYQGKIYLAGGEYYGGQDDFSIYDINSDTWITGPDIPRPAVGALLTAWDGKLYLVGGAPDGNLDPVNQVDIYDIATNTWIADALPHLPVATANPGYAQVGPYLYLAGGCSGDFNHNVTATQRFDLSHPEGEWQLGPEFTSARCAPVMVATAHRLYAYGGDEDGGWLIESTDLVEVLDLSEWPLGTWKDLNDPLPKLTQANFSNACTELKAGGEIWSIGGANATVYPYEYFDTTLYYPAEPCVSYGVDLPESWSGGTARSGQTLTYTLFITNTGVVTDYFTLDIASDWIADLPIDEIGPVGAGESAQVDFTVNVPMNAQWGIVGITEITATSFSNPAAIDATSVMITAYWPRIFMPFLMK